MAIPCPASRHAHLNGWRAILTAYPPLEQTGLRVFCKTFHSIVLSLTLSLKILSLPQATSSKRKERCRSLGDQVRGASAECSQHARLRDGNERAAGEEEGP